MSEEPGDHLDLVGEIAGDLGDLGLDPVLVGGMALVVLGSRRVTRDFDFVVGHPAERLSRLVDVFYDHGLELVAKLNDEGDPISTIESRRVALVRLRIDTPAGVHFFNPRSGLRIDLLFDFPIPAVRLAQDATVRKIQGRPFAVASVASLLRLKKIAVAKRSAPGDAEDLAFLKSLRRRPPAG